MDRDKTNMVGSEHKQSGYRGRLSQQHLRNDVGSATLEALAIRPCKL